MLFIDSHAHLSGGDFTDAELEAVLQRSDEQLVSTIVNICTHSSHLEHGMLLQKKHPKILLAGATPPQDVEDSSEEEFTFFAKHAREGTLAAVGETGLDYYFTEDAKVHQKYLFTRYLHLAKECNLPVVIHCRSAFKDLFEVLDAEYVKEGKVLPFIIHCFTGNEMEANEVLKRGGYISLSGIVTFKKSEELKLIAKHVPLENLLIETDSPYLAPQSKRGTKNEPCNVVEVAKCIADLKGLPLEEVARATTKNATAVF